MKLVEHEIEGSISRIRLNRPERLNAVTPGLVEGLVSALSQAEEADVGAVILTGNGRAFCAGHDLHDHNPSPDLLQLGRELQQIQEVTRLVRRLPCPVIAAVHGYALGAGCEFALCSDIVIAADTAEFGFPEVGVGLSVTGGISHVLPTAIGFARAKEMLLLGERFGAATAESLGLVNRIVSAERLEIEAQEMALKLADRPRFAMALAKQAIDRGPGSTLEDSLATEVYHAQMAMTSGEAESAMSTFRAARVATNAGNDE